MSHFVVYVLTRHKPTGDLERTVAPLLAPFDENMEVEPYEEECYCVGRAAKIDCDNQVDLALGTIEHHRRKFHERHPSTDDGHSDEEEEKREKLWRSEVIEPRDRAGKGLYDQHPLKDKPDPKCSECGGTGKEESTRNPNSKWDWYAIGGRWSGQFLEGYEAERDPRNWTKCELCGGTGSRPDGIAGIGKCNGCNDGKGDEKLGIPPGFRLAWPTQWVAAPPEGDLTPVAALLARDEVAFKKIVPFALVTPDGVWHEKGRMGWWAMVSDKKPVREWNTEVRQLFETWPEAWAINVDCHI